MNINSILYGLRINHQVSNINHKDSLQVNFSECHKLAIIITIFNYIFQILIQVNHLYKLYAL